MVHVVTGAPCAGKTTFVNNHKSNGDIVIDLDALAVSLGAENAHEYSKDIFRAALAAREAAISSIGNADAWIIHTKPTNQQRAEYKGAVFHDLDPGIYECVKRAKSDKRPIKTINAIYEWYGEQAPQGAFSMPKRAHALSTELHSKGTLERITEPLHSDEQRACIGRKGVSMADEQVQENAQVDEPQGEDTKQTDWKAEARKWESRAKKSEKAEQELMALKAAQMTEQEKAIARAEAAESELAQLKAQQVHYADARELSSEYGVPLELLECCADRDAMVKAVTVLKGNQSPIHAASQSSNTRLVKGNGELSNRDKFALAVESLIR